MTQQTIAGFPYYEAIFDSDGKLQDGAPDKIESPITDLFVWCHGWNMSHDAAREQVEEFFGQVGTVLKGAKPRLPAAPAILGIYWPSSVDGAASGGWLYHRIVEYVEIAESFWAMKALAGKIGRGGVASYLQKIWLNRKSKTDRMNLHLAGHSFGAKLMSHAANWCLVPVRSLFLVQGAFSHWAFAEEIPHESDHVGALTEVPKRVTGPVCVTHSKNDSALGVYYPLGCAAACRRIHPVFGRLPSPSLTRSLLHTDDYSRWGAMGHDGAQGCVADHTALGRVGTDYSDYLRPFSVTNLDATAVIKNGPWPAGAHGDIYHPEVAWAFLAAAGIV